MFRMWHKTEIKFPLFYWNALNWSPWHNICPYIDIDGIFARHWQSKGCWKGRLWVHSTGSISTNQHVCRRRSVMFSVHKVWKRIVGHLDFHVCQSFKKAKVQLLVSTAALVTCCWFKIHHLYHSWHFYLNQIQSILCLFHPFQYMSL